MPVKVPGFHRTVNNKGIQYPLATDTWGQEEILALQRVVASGRYTMGDEVKKFEQEFAEYFNVQHAVMVNSGSSANLLMLTALTMLKGRGNVIVPAVGWSTSYFPIHQTGCEIRFVDVDPLTFNIDVEQAEQAINEETVAIMPIHLLGNPSQLDRIDALCKKHNLWMLEDNCESLGASFHDRFTGTWGKMGTFSFFFSHHMQTMEGGMILTNDTRVDHLLRSLRAHGWVRDLPEENYVLNKLGDDFRDSFRFATPGYCVRPLEMSGATGREQLKKWPKQFQGRKLNARMAKDLFAAVPNVRLQQETEQSSWFGFGLVLEGPLATRRPEVIAGLAVEKVETRPIVTGNFLNQPVIEQLNCSVHGKIEHAEEIDQAGLFVGNRIDDLYHQLKLVADVIDWYNRN